MNRVRLLICALGLIARASLAAGANDGMVLPPGQPLAWIRTSADRRHFVCDGTDHSFVPWGFNYDHDEVGRFLEDYWADDWAKVADDFREMKSLGANVVRIHLQLCRFMKSAEQPDEINLARLGKLVRLAEATGVYLDVTGLGCYHKEDVPSWYDAMDESARWKVQARFWSAVVEVCKNSPAIFCYDLMNEPVASGDRKGDWLPGTPLGGSYFMQRLTTDMQGRTDREVAKEWIAELSAAIRSVDQRHLITVGLVSWEETFGPGAKSAFQYPDVSAALDFLSVHYYPRQGKLDDDLAILKFYDLGKPLVIEEMFPLSADVGTTEEFIRRSRTGADGWISFYWGKTPEEYDKEPGIKAALTGRWLRHFCALRGETLGGAVSPAHQTPQVKDTGVDWPKTIPELQAAIEKVLKETRTPGAGIALVSRDKAEWVAGIGKADVAANKPATAETLFRTGSTGKAFAALAALQLQEADKLKLTDTVRQWVPDVAFSNPWEATAPVRLVHLMEHTSGFDDIHLREYALNEPTPIPLKDALAFGASSRVCRWPPGSRMSYCNSGPAVLAAVIEKISGQHFEDYVQEHFFHPLHMDTASYFYTPAVQQRLTKLYQSDGVTPYPYWHIAYRAAGSINASPKGMANYARFYLQRGSFDGKQLLQPASITRMETPETLPSAQLGRMAGYGLYNCETLEGAFVFHGHGGAVEGGLTDVAYLPDFGRGYALMINSGNFRALTRISELVRHYLIRGLTPPALPPVACVPADVQRHYNGYYQFISPRSQLTYGLKRLLEIEWLGFTSNSVSLIGLSRAHMVPVTERLFRKKDESIATLALLPDSDGETLIQYDWMNFAQSPGAMTFKKVPGWRVWGGIFGMIVVSIAMLSSPLRVLVWVARKISGKLHNAGPLSLRLMPLLSTLLFGTMWGLIFFNRGQFGGALGSCCGASVGIMLSSIAFALAAAASLYLVYRQRRTPMNRFAYWRSVLVAIGVSTAAVYMGYWGWIGLRLWAY